MQFFKITAALVTLVTVSAGARLPTNAADGALGLVNSTMKWIGPSKGVNITLYGTAMEIEQQLKDLDPDWVPVPHTKPVIPAEKISAAAGNSTLATRGPPGLLCCPVSGQDFHLVSWDLLVMGYDQLLRIGGNCITSNGQCSLSECYDGAGIYLCSPLGDGTVNVPCTSVAEHALNIETYCPWTVGALNVCGQQFSMDPWNVVVTSC